MRRLNTEPESPGQPAPDESATPSDPPGATRRASLPGAASPSDAATPADAATTTPSGATPGAAAAAIDAANADDPTIVVVRGERQPLAQVHGRLAVEWVDRLRPDADDAVRLAARAHHLRRWEVPRSSYPEGRAGYLRWRRDQKQRHAGDVEVILRGCGYDDDTVARVQALVRRDRLATDHDAQLVEDAACLVFIETQLAEVSERLDHDHLLDVIRKTARKMSPAGLAAVADIDLGDVERRLLAEALGGNALGDG